MSASSADPDELDDGAGELLGAVDPGVDDAHPATSRTPAKVQGGDCRGR